MDLSDFLVTFLQEKLQSNVECRWCGEQVELGLKVLWVLISEGVFLSLSLCVCVCVCVCGCAAQVQPAAQRSRRTRRAGSTPRRHPYIGAGGLPGRLASQSKVVRASYLPAGRVPAVYLMIPQAPPQQAHGSNGCQLGTATTKPTM